MDSLNVLQSGSVPGHFAGMVVIGQSEHLWDRLDALNAMAVVRHLQGHLHCLTQRPVLKADASRPVSVSRLQ
jgi:hypothetical protein